MRTRPFVIGIAGTSGSGKSTLSAALASRLPGAVELSFDDYIAVSNTPTDILSWLDEGADLNAFQTPHLSRNLAALREGSEATTPKGERLVPGEYLLVEEPFGRERQEVAELIDLVVFVDTPLDIALARRVLRTLNSGSRPPEQQLQHIAADLTAFLYAGRRAYLVAAEAARRSADLILGGTSSTQVWADEVVQELQQRGRPTV